MDILWTPVVLLVIVTIWLIRRAKKKPDGQKAPFATPTTPSNGRRDCVGYYVKMWPRPPAFIATQVPTEAGRVDVMFFSGTERIASHLDPNMRQLLATAQNLLPIMPEDASHRAACRAELDRYVTELSRRLTAASMSQEDKETLAFFQAVLGEHEPNAIPDALRRFSRGNHQKDGAVNITRLLQPGQRPTLPDQPIRRHTRSTIRLRPPPK